MSEVQLSIANLGTRNVVKKISEDLVVASGTADATTTKAVVFERSFQEIPTILSVNPTEEGAETMNVYAANVTKLGFDLKGYNTITTVTATYAIEIIVQGQQAPGA